MELLLHTASPAPPFPLTPGNGDCSGIQTQDICISRGSSRSNQVQSTSKDSQESYDSRKGLNSQAIIIQKSCNIPDVMHLAHRFDIPNGRYLQELVEICFCEVSKYLETSWGKNGELICDVQPLQAAYWQNNVMC